MDRGSGGWMFRRLRRREHAGLDRLVSASQPDLLRDAHAHADEHAHAHAQSDNATKLQSGEEKLHKPTVLQLVQTHQKSSSLGSACLERLEGGGEGLQGPPAPPPDPPPPPAGSYRLDIELKRGNNLAARDRGGTSDPYVKFKLGGREVFRSRTVHKSLNPEWEQRASLLVEGGLGTPLYVKVFDYDFGLQDDFMGSAFLHLDSLEQQRTVPVTLVLRDPQLPDQDLGSLELDVTLTPTNSPPEEPRDPALGALRTCRWRPYVSKTMLLRRSWKRSTKQQQSLRLSDLHRKSQLWRGIVSIALIEGRGLSACDANGLSDPYVKFRLGAQKYRSKTVPKTLSPQWREQFDLHLFEETLLEISVWDKDTGRRDDFIGRCQLDLAPLARERTHRLQLPLQDSRGRLLLLVTLTASAAVSIAELSAAPLTDPRERDQILKLYSASRSFSHLRDVGIVQVKVLRAEGLMAADVTGKSDPFCVLELNNDRLQTHTVYKNLSPEWNKVFTFNVKDIHSVLEVTVFDEDRDRSADFLGKVAIPLLSVRNGEQKGYLLKNKDLTGPTKGIIHLEIEVIYNTVKAALRTMVPAEQKYIEEEPKVSKQLLQQNFSRLKRCVLVLLGYGSFINSCFEWESVQRSLLAFLLFVVVVWNFELYMLPLGLSLLLVWNYFFCPSRTDDTSMEAMFEWEEEEDEKEEKDSEPRGFLDRLYAIQDVFLSVQGALDGAASLGERIKNTLNWTVPFLSWLAIAGLVLTTILLYLVPLRLLVLAWGINKFTKKLRDPFMIDNNELLDFLSRVPSDLQVMQYRELKVDPGQSPSKRRRTNQS